MKKILLFICCIFILGFNIPYKYNSEKVVNYAVNNANTKSKCMCAWYVMRALQNGGCYICLIYPAYAYEQVLPKLGFTEIKSNELKRGDICVLSQNSKSGFGHIAVYDGKNWYSDYFQKSIYPNKIYQNESSIHYFRQTNGWHVANVWVSPINIIKYIKVFINNINRIKFL